MSVTWGSSKVEDHRSAWESAKEIFRTHKGHDPMTSEEFSETAMIAEVIRKKSIK